MSVAAPSVALSHLTALVQATGWPGDTARLCEATPHLQANLTARDMTRSLENLGLSVQSIEGVRLRAIAASDCPCLFVPDAGTPLVILDVRETEILIAGEVGQPAWVSAGSGRGCLISVDRTAVAARPDESLRDIVRSFRGTFALLVGISFFTGLLGFAAPVLIMVVYDRLIPTASVEFLWALVIGMAGVLATDIALRTIRGRSLAWMGAQIERRMGLALFRKLAVLPVDKVQATAVEQQIARLKQFEGLRGIFTGPLLTTLLDLPFILMFFTAICFLDLEIGLLILGLAATFGVAALVTVPSQTRLNARSAQEREVLSALMLEASTQQRSIQRFGLGKIWTERCEAALVRTATAARAARQVSHMGQIFGQSLMIAAGIGCVYLGTTSALSGEVSFGALIALISLTWKVLAPVQMLYSSAYQVAGHLRSGRQVETFLSLPEERRRGPSRSPYRRFRGTLRLEGVTHRYSAITDPALAGASVEIAAGELVVVCGRNGAGKSTFLKLLGGLHPPTNGSILIDGIDYRQIALDELRDSINYVAQTAEFFHGSVLQNFQLASPTATEEDVRATLEEAGLGPEVALLPEGLQTRLSEEVRRTLPTGTMQAMSVARGLMRNRALYLLDEPASGIGMDHEDALCQRLELLRGHRTVVMVSDRPSHFSLADRLILLDRGRVVINDTGPEALRKVRALYSSMRKV